MWDSFHGMLRCAQHDTPVMLVLGHYTRGELFKEKYKMAHFSINAGGER